MQSKKQQTTTKAKKEKNGELKMNACLKKEAKAEKKI